MNDSRDHVVIPSSSTPKGAMVAPKIVLGAITFETIDCYARRYGIVGSNFEFYRRVIRSLDTEYRKLHHER